VGHTKKLLQHTDRLSPENVLPLVDMCLPSLKQLSSSQYQSFKSNVVALIRADKKVNIFEWALYRILLHNLEPQKLGGKIHSLHSCLEECRILLSMLAHAGHQDGNQSRAAYETSFSMLGLGSRFYLDASLISLSDLDQALDKLRKVKPLQKPQLLKALVACVSHDQKISVVEGELFRAIADSLDCPVPPLLPSKPL